jgi:hypothetical protein
MNLNVFFFFVIIASTFLTACSNSTTNEQAKIAAKVGNYILTIDEAVARVPQIKLVEDSVNSVKFEIQRWIDERVMLLESDRLNLADDELIAKKLDRMRSSVLIESLEQTIQNSSSINVTDDEILAFYRVNSSLFLLQEEHVNIEWFYHENISVVNTVRDQVLRGKPLGQIIEKLGNGSFKDDNLQSYQQLLSRTVFNDLAPIRFKRRALSVGDISDIYYYQGKNAFLKVTGIQSKGTISDFESVRLRINDWLLAEKQKKNVLAYRRSLYLKAQSNNQIEIFFN